MNSSFAFSRALTKLIFLPQVPSLLSGKGQTQILIQAAYTRPAKLFLKPCQGDEEEEEEDDDDDDDNEVPWADVNILVNLKL